MFWPHVVCACVYELAESKYTVPHITPKRTFAATHISDRSNFLTRFECLTALQVAPQSVECAQCRAVNTPRE